MTVTASSHASRPLSAVVVGLDEATRLLAVTTLSQAGFEVTTVDRFENAKAQLNMHPPSVLLTAVRLGEYNGLHLVLEAKTVDPRIAALVTIDAPDPVLEKEAEQLGATFIVKPASSRDLLAAVCRTLLRQPGDRTPVRPPFERRHFERRASASTYTPDRRGGERRRNQLAWLNPPTVFN